MFKSSHPKYSGPLQKAENKVKLSITTTPKRTSTTHYPRLCQQKDAFCKLKSAYKETKKRRSMPALENFIITTTAPASATRHRAEPAAPPPRIIVACQKAGRPAMAHRLYLFSFNATTKDERCETECSEQSNNFAEMWMPHKACNRHARRAENSAKGNSPGQADRLVSTQPGSRRTTAGQRMVVFQKSFIRLKL